MKYSAFHTKIIVTFQEVLENDQSNYNALVFEGAAREGLEQSDLALESYTKAATLDAKQALAWQVLLYKIIYIIVLYHYYLIYKLLNNIHFH